MRRCIILTTIGVLGALGTASVARAQINDRKDFDANRLRVTGGAEEIFNVYSGAMPGHLEWDVGLWLNYANNAVVLTTQKDDGSTERFMSLLTHRADAHFVGTLALFEYLQLALDVPVAFYQERTDPRLEASGLEGIAAAGVGDITLNAKIRILRDEDHYLDLALIPQVTFPVATPGDNYFGEKTFSGGPEIAISKTFFNFTVAGNVAARFRELVFDTVGGIEISHEMVFRLGAQYDFREKFDAPARVGVTWEGFSQAARFLADPNGGGSELLLGAGYEVTDVAGVPMELFGGFGFGLEAGYSIPDWRAFLGLAFHWRARDLDGDGLEGAADGCPEDPEDMDGFEDADGCPENDNDQDGVLDQDDGAPMDAEDRDNFEDADGVPDPDNDQDGVLDVDDLCPVDAGPKELEGCPDKDGDGLIDGKDACPDAAEDVDEFEDTDGCPDPDNDGDTVLDGEDRCPLEAGVSENGGCPDQDRDGDTVVDRLDNCPDVAGSVENNGCKQKQLVTIKGCKIDLSQKVYFDTGRSTIRSQSFSLMDNIFELLKAQDQLKKIRIEGHTDSSGNAEVNKKLSRDRAESVKLYLVRAGIEESRLEAVGFGEERPIATNSSRRGREANRRVELVIADCQEVTKEVEVEQ